MAKRIVFVAGIHGVGKTHMCERLSKDMGIPHHSASGLIKKIINVQFAVDKKIKEINKNQDHLIEAIRQFLPPGGTCLLDGHFCLLDQDGSVKRIPHTTFFDMSPVAIVVLVDDPEILYKRKITRDKSSLNVEDIADFQRKEIEYATEIAKRLNVPYIEANPISDIEDVKEFISGLLDKEKSHESTS